MGTGLLALVAVVAVAVLALVFFKPWSLLMPASSGQGSAASVSEPAAPPTPAGALSGILSPAASTPLPEGTAQPMAPAASSSPLPSPTGATRSVASTPQATTSSAPTPSSRPAGAATASRPTSTPARPTVTPVATPSGTSGAAAVKIYTVKEGDNLYSLARTFGVTVEDLMKANNLQDRSVLRVGQTLVVPSPAQ